MLFRSTVSAPISCKSAAADQTNAPLLKDNHPKSMLHVKATPVLRARFPVIDLHEHVNDASGIGDRGQFKGLSLANK
jgi:hypothetical protein